VAAGAALGAVLGAVLSAGAVLGAVEAAGVPEQAANIMQITANNETKPSILFFIKIFPPFILFTDFIH
jgi:hypothetical protein